MDWVIYHRVLAILAEVGLTSPISHIEDFDPDFSIKNIGPHRLYEFHLEIRDDVDLTDFVADFSAIMTAYNKISNIKVDFYEANEYPGPIKNWHTAYLTVTSV